MDAWELGAIDAARADVGTLYRELPAGALIAISVPRSE